MHVNFRRRSCDCHRDRDQRHRLLSALLKCYATRKCSFSFQCEVRPPREDRGWHKSSCNVWRYTENGGRRYTANAGWGFQLPQAPRGGGGFDSLRLSLASIHEPRYTFFTTLEAAAGRNVAASCMKEHMRQVLLVVREEPGASLLPFSH